jgi:hypothetical protein
MNRPQKTNNPGNLRYVKQKYATPDVHGFCQFQSAWKGWIALVKQIQLDQGRDLTFGEFIGKYAPEVENDTRQYLQFVCNGLGVEADMKLKNRASYAIAGMIAKMEGYFVEAD